MNSSTQMSSTSSLPSPLSSIPQSFTWPKEDLAPAKMDLAVPVVDLKGVLAGDEVATEEAAKLIREACSGLGVFHVTNHAVDSGLIAAAYDHLDRFFKMPREEKMKSRGYSSAHRERFSSKLLWKETLSMEFHESSGDNTVVLDFFKSNFGEDFEPTGLVYQKYCEALNGLALAIMELVGLSLGLDRTYYRDFFEDGYAIMRCNYYPACPEPSLTLGTGPHFDPTSLTLLHQDQVGGLDVHTDHGWQTVAPRQDSSFVVMIGETFKAASNGKYESCLHRALVNEEKDRRSLTFFLCPRKDKVVSPPPELLRAQGMLTRVYPDFTWGEFLLFTQRHYRPDANTLHNFTQRILNSEQPAARLLSSS